MGFVLPAAISPRTSRFVLSVGGGVGSAGVLDPSASVDAPLNEDAVKDIHGVVSIFFSHRFSHLTISSRIISLFVFSSAIAALSSFRVVAAVSLTAVMGSYLFMHLLYAINLEMATNMFDTS